VEELAYWVDRVGLFALAQATSLSILLFAGTTVVVLLLEMRRSRSTAIIRSRAFAMDVAYAAFYRGGFYQVLIFAGLANAFDSQLSFLRLGWLSDLPQLVALAVYWILGDFFLYWLHRAYHAFPVLWAFHAVHHADTELNTLSTNRRHVVEGTLNSLVLYLPLAFVLGIDTEIWLPWYVAAQILEALQHAQLDWRFGPFYRWVVSPVFHSIHHSTDQAHFDRNFGLMFSVWDYLFGTAAVERERPVRTGIDGIVIRETIGDQVFAPFRILGWSRQPEPPPAPDQATDQSPPARADST